MNDAHRNKDRLSPEYFEAVRRANPAILAAAKEAQKMGHICQPLRGKKGFLIGWPGLPEKEPLDIDREFRSPKGECFNVGGVISAHPQGDAPSLILDVDLHDVKDQQDIDDCMAAKRRLVGDMQPTIFTGGGGEHFHLRMPPALVEELFAAGNSFLIERQGRVPGERAALPPGAPKPRWVIEVFGPRHGYPLAPSIHPDTLKPYRYGCDFPRTRPAPDSLIAAMRAERPSAGSREWGPRRPLVAPLPPVLKFAPDLQLPEAVRDWCIDVAERMGCPIDFIAVALFVVLGSLVGATCAIRPKVHDTWAVAANLWGGLLGDPGIYLKTAALEAAVKMLAPLIKSENEQFLKKMQDHVVAMKKHSAKVKGAQELLKVAAKKGAKPGGNEDEEIDRLTEALRGLEEKAPKPPIERRFITNDPTVERAGEMIRDNNGRGLLYCRDEMAGIIQPWERDERKGEKAFWLEAYNGLSPYDTDRIGRGRISIPLLNASMLGGLQPDIWAAVLERTSNLGNDGLVQRFQLLVYPDPVGWRWTDESPDFVAHKRVSQVFASLANLEPKKWGAFQQDEDRFPYFGFDAAAQAIFIKWLTELQTVRIINEDNLLIRQHLVKYSRLFPALALICHLIDRSEGPDAGEFVSATSAYRAAAWCEYLESHARRCYALLGHHKLRGARHLAKKIEDGELGDGFTAHDVHRRQWADLTTIEAVAVAITWLEGEGWVRAGPRAPSGPTGGRPTVRYEIHPELKGGKP